MILPNQKDIKEAVRALRLGQIVAFPTDTVYGLAVNPFIKKGVDKIFQIKGRSTNIALPLLLANIEDIQIYASNISNDVWKLVERFLPGGLTIVLPKSENSPSHICGNRKNIALRVPDHPVPRLLASELSLPITGTSANLTGQPACISADCVKNQFKTLVNVVIDGGTIRGTKSSTVIDASNDSIKLIREGTIGKNAIEEVIGYKLESI